MRKKIIFIALMVSFSFFLFSSPGRTLGNFYFSKPITHGEVVLKPGTYKVSLIEKNGIPYFQVYKGKELKIEEMGIVLPSEKKLPFSVKKELLKGGDYIRIKVCLGDKIIYGYFYTP